MPNLKIIKIDEASNLLNNIEYVYYTNSTILATCNRCAIRLRSPLCPIINRSLKLRNSRLSNLFLRLHDIFGRFKDVGFRNRFKKYIFHLKLFFLLLIVCCIDLLTQSV